MRRLSVALQKGNAMTFDAYCEWRNTRDLRVHGQAGFIYSETYKQQRRPRQADAYLFRRFCAAFQSFGQRARVKFLRIGYLVNVSMQDSCMCVQEIGKHCR
jgi:hypothetical protein